MTKLNLGAGNDWKQGYFNIDNSPLVKPDLVIDLEEPNCLKLFDDNSVDEILCYHILEHINNFIPLMKELHRVCKAGAKIYVRCPYGVSMAFRNDPTHKRIFDLYTFNYFKYHNYSHEVGVAKGGDMFDCKFKLNFGIGKSSCLNWLINPIVNFFPRLYAWYFSFWLPCSEIRYELTCLKEEGKK